MNFVIRGTESYELSMLKNENNLLENRDTLMWNYIKTVVYLQCHPHINSYKYTCIVVI